MTSSNENQSVAPTTRSDDVIPHANNTFADVVVVTGMTSSSTVTIMSSSTAMTSSVGSITSSSSAGYTFSHYTTRQIDEVSDVRMVTSRATNERVDNYDFWTRRQMGEVATGGGPEVVAAVAVRNWAFLGLVAFAVWILSGNLLVMLAVKRFRRLRTLSNLVISSLALTDFLLALIVVPSSIYQLVSCLPSGGIKMCYLPAGESYTTGYKVKTAGDSHTV